MRTEYIFMSIAAPAFITVPILTAIVHYRTLPYEGRVLFVYLLFDALVSIASSALAYYHLPNTPLYHFATMVDTVLLLYFFRQVNSFRPLVRLLQAAMFLFPLLAVLNLLLLQPLLSFNSYMLALKAILIVGLCFFYWWQYTPDAAKPWKQIPLHWIVSGLLLYFSSAFILFTFSDFLVSVATKKTFIVLWNIHAGLSVIMFLLFAIGLRNYKV